MVMVTSVTPAAVQCAGLTMVEILGADFRQQTQPTVITGPVPPRPPSVLVFFGTTPAVRVRVTSPTRLLVTVPPHAAGATNVRVVNVDDLGAPLEEATLAGGITYRLPDLVNVGDLSLVARMLIRALKQQVTPEVVLSSVVDYDDDPEDIPRKTAVVKLPAMWLVGPTIRRTDAIRNQVGPVAVEGGAGEYEYRAPRIVDLVFSVGVAAESYNGTLNLVQAATAFFVRAGRLTVAGVDYDMELEVDFDVNSSPTENSLFSARGTVAILAVPLLGMPNESDDLRTDEHPALAGCPELETVGR